MVTLSIRVFCVHLQKKLTGFRLLVLVLIPILARAQESEDFTELDLEKLLVTETIELTSVSKKPGNLFNAPSAVAVLTRDEILKSGVTSVPEALRLIPGMHVARFEGNNWNVAARGFGGPVLNKLLVLLDGRSIYDPSFSGVFWNLSTPVLSDIERIEVIRGPGAVIWGVNAVNGVVNIITRNSKDTLEFAAAAGLGTEEKGILSARQGFQLQERISGRIYAAHNRRDALQLASGRTADNDTEVSRAGVRVDYNGDLDIVTLQGDFVWDDGRQDQQLQEGAQLNIIPLNYQYSWKSLQARWTDLRTPGYNSTWQAYIDRFESFTGATDQRRTTYDLDFHKHMPLGDSQSIVWGAGVRRIQDEITSGGLADYTPENDEFTLANAFIQSEWILSKPLKLLIGTKLSYHDFVGIEWQPGVKVSYQPNSASYFWFGTTRAVRTPSRFERDVTTFSQTAPEGIGSENLFTSIRGSRNVQSENLLSFEMGFRQRVNKSTTVDLQTYFNRYDDITVVAPGLPTQGSGVSLIPLNITNDATAQSFGAEARLDWTPGNNLKTTLSYTFFKDFFNIRAPLGIPFDISSPEHIAFLRLDWAANDKLHLNSTLRYSDRLLAPLGGNTESYLQLDCSLGWTVTKSILIQLVGQNLLQSSQQEYVDFGRPGRIMRTQRGVYSQIRWNFD